MIEEPVIKILERELEILKNQINNYKNIQRNNKDLIDMKTLLNSDRFSIIKIIPSKLLEIFQNYNVENADELFNDAKYIIYMYKYFLSFKSVGEFSQKLKADLKFEKILNKINSLNFAEIGSYQEISELYNNMQIVYDKLTKNLYTSSINETDVINYINNSSKISDEDKSIFINSIYGYNEQITKILNNHKLEDLKEKNKPTKKVEFDKYIVSFCQTLKLLEEREIEQNLPDSVMVNCIYILNSLLKYIDYELEVNNNAINNNGISKEILEGITLDNKKLNKVKNIVSNYKLETEKAIMNEFENENTGIIKNNVIYLNDYIFKDIKGITEEMYSEVIKAIEDLENGQFSTNKTKHKKMTNNKNLRGVFQLKRETVRLLYMSLGNNTYIVIQADQKNTQYDSALIERTAIRASEYRTKSAEIRGNLPAHIIRGNEITEEVKSILNENKRKM